MIQQEETCRVSEVNSLSSKSEGHLFPHTGNRSTYLYVHTLTTNLLLWSAFQSERDKDVGEDGRGSQRRLI